MEILEELFSSGTLVKILRLFLFNEESAYDADMLADITRSKKSDVNYEMRLLLKIGFVKKKSFSKEVISKRAGKTRTSKKKTNGWVLNPEFRYVEQLRALLIKTELISEQKIIQTIKKAGKIKLLLVAGVFLHDLDARVDMLIVAEKVNKRSLSTAIRDLEAAVGRELSYTLLDPDSYAYRTQVRDKLLRDIFDREYQILVHNSADISVPVGTLSTTSGVFREL